MSGKELFYIEPCRDGECDDNETDVANDAAENESNERSAYASKGKDLALKNVYTVFDEKMKDMDTGEVNYFIKTIPGKVTVMRPGSAASKFPNNTYFSSSDKDAKAFRHFILNKDPPSVLAIFEVFDKKKSDNNVDGDDVLLGPEKKRFDSIGSFKKQCAEHSTSVRMLLQALSDEERSKYPTMTGHDDLDSWDAFMYPRAVAPSRASFGGETEDISTDDEEEDSNEEDTKEVSASKGRLPKEHRSYVLSRSSVFYLTKTSRLNPSKLKCFVCIKSTSGPLMEKILSDYVRRENKTFSLKDYVRMCHSCSETAVRNCCRVAYMICSAANLSGNFEKEKPDTTHQRKTEEEEDESDDDEKQFYSYPVRCLPTFVQYYNTSTIHNSLRGDEEAGEILLASFNGTIDVRETCINNACKIMVYVSGKAAFASVPVDAFGHPMPIAAARYASLEELMEHRKHMGALHASESEMNDYMRGREALETVRSTGFTQFFPHPALDSARRPGWEGGGEGNNDERKKEAVFVPPHPLHLKFYEIHNV